MSKLETYLFILQQAGLRLTAQRRAICEYLATSDKHPTPYMVYADLVQQHPDISRATVYNTLNTLQRLGAIAEISFGDDHTHYETNLTPHINLICLRCHQVVDYPGQALVADLTQPLLAATGFQSMATKVEVLGLCPACQTQSRK
jgi:Fur family peroxide stress response transcriptional regulator